MQKEKSRESRLSRPKKASKSKLRKKFKFPDKLDVIAGLDEAGRGPLAGPVVAACVILPKDCSISGIRDSKKLTPKAREKLYDKIMEQATSVGIGIISEKIIDRINILKATYKAMRKAVRNMKVKPDCVFVDGFRVPGARFSQVPLKKGDDLSVFIAAASIVAKVTRDRLMSKLHKVHPKYGFIDHKGYGTRKHVKALKKHGPCKIHRKTFYPVSELVKN